MSGKEAVVAEGVSVSSSCACSSDRSSDGRASVVADRSGEDSVGERNPAGVAPTEGKAAWRSSRFRRLDAHKDQCGPNIPIK